MIDLFFILFNTYCGIYSILKESKYAAMLLSINNETECVGLLLLSLRRMIYAQFFRYFRIFGKLSLKKYH